MDQACDIANFSEGGQQQLSICNKLDHGDLSLDQLLKQYRANKKPIQVNFRMMVNWISYGERASHMIHLYPAKLLPHIPAYFLANNILSSKGDLVLDPFCGSGTVMLEAILANRQAIGADSNPLARLIAKVKITALERKKLISTYKRLQERISKTKFSNQYPDVVNIDLWFHPHVKKELSHIKQCIDVIRDQALKDFFRVCFSNTLKRVSLADPNVSVPVRLKKEKYPKSSPHYTQVEKIIDKLEDINVYQEFFKITETNIKRINAFTEATECGSGSIIIYDDARKLGDKETRQKDESVQLVITSPPYSGAQKYIRSSGLNLGWLDYCKSNELRKFEIKNIGREHYSKHEYNNPLATGIKEADSFLKKIFKEYPLRAHIASNYLNEMRHAFKEIYRVLKYDGYFVLIIANNHIRGKEFFTKDYLQSIAEEIGLKTELCLIDDIHSRGLMTKRNKTANIISREWVLVFKKVH